jgi:hypothetical protein
LRTAVEVFYELIPMLLGVVRVLGGREKLVDEGISGNCLRSNKQRGDGISFLLRVSQIA